jgi:hypothetical protein
MNDKREHFRIKYREGDRPTLVMGGVKFEVLDLSEQGLRFDGGQRYKPAAKAVIRGTITLKSGKSCAVSGTLLRYDAIKHACIVQLEKGIPLTLIMEEQRAMLKKGKASA